MDTSSTYSSRTAEAAGAHGIIIPKRRSASLNHTVFKTSAGAASWLPVARVANLASAVDMLKNNGGSIVNIGSMASCGGDLGATAYASAKAGVDLLTKSTAMQYGKSNIRCNCVRPGQIVTPENDAYVAQAVKDIFLSNIMVNRYGCPEDIGHLCVYLASDESAYVTGQVMTVDGGMNSHAPTVAQFVAMGSRTW